MDTMKGFQLYHAEWTKKAECKPSAMGSQDTHLQNFALLHATGHVWGIFRFDFTIFGMKFNRMR